LSKWKKLRASPFLALDVALAPSQILSPAGEMHGFFHETYFNGSLTLIVCLFPTFDPSPILNFHPFHTPREMFPSESIVLRGAERSCHQKMDASSIQPPFSIFQTGFA
jgi:hypothetical protein